MIFPADKRWECPKCRAGKSVWVNPPCERKCQMCGALRVPKDRIDTIMLMKELSDFCRSESLSEDGLRKMYDRYKLAPDKKYVCNNYGFFHSACSNGRATEGIIRCLLKYFPAAVWGRADDDRRWSPLHYACDNPNVTLSIIQPLVDTAPNSVRCVTCYDETPLHHLCFNSEVDETAAIQILKLLVEKYPEVIWHADNYGHLPIHLAAGTKSPEFCRVLIEAYPGSEKIPDAVGALPFHFACEKGSLATIEYLYSYHDANNHATAEGYYPIHYAIDVGDRDKPAAAVDIVQFLLNCDPGQKFKQFHGQPLLHYACGRKYNESNVEAGIQIIKILLDANPDSIRSENDDGWMPLHALCNINFEKNETAAIQILKLLIEKYPEAVRHPCSNGDLPIHFAAETQSPDFCRLLIEAYPGSEKTTDADGALPFHFACGKNTVATVEYLYRQYPGAIDHATTDGFYPIHYAIEDVLCITAVETVRFLLNCDPNQMLIQIHGKSLLHASCEVEYDDSNEEAGIKMIKTLYDAYPEAIEDCRIKAGIQRFRQQVQKFIRRELVYARLAEDIRLMTTSDVNGRLPLHRALQNNVRLGSIKLLVKGNPYAIAMRNSDNIFAMPLHIACEHHDSAVVVQYLLDLLDAETLQSFDIDNNTALHYACRGAKYDTIALLLEKYAALVSKRNVDGKLPIDLLWESNEVQDRESVEYTGSVFQLLRAQPEMLAISNWIEKQSNDADSTRHGKKIKQRRKRKRSGLTNIPNSEQPVDADATRNGTKRKFGHE